MEFTVKTQNIDILKLYWLTITSPKSMKSIFLAKLCALNKIKTLTPHASANSSSSIRLNKLQQAVKSQKSKANKKMQTLQTAG